VSKSRTIIGIDLGTTNSCVAIFRDSRAEVVKNMDGESITPSVVNFDPKKGEFSVGLMAINRERQFPQDTIRVVKRLMGKSYAQAIDENIHEGLNYKIVASNPKAADGGAVQIEIAGKLHPPEEISAAILAYLKKSVSEAEDEEITEAVITVPAYFDETQRQATINAGKIAGLNVRKLINEPAAAALSYALDNSSKNTDSEIIAVYDLGGGTFDITIAQTGTEKEATVNYTDLSVLSHEGNNHLGGVDFDNVLVRLFKERFKNEHNVELESLVTGKDLEAAEAILQREAEKAKKALSRRSEYDVSISGLCKYQNKILGILFKLTRQEFEQATAYFVDQTLICCQDALNTANLSKDQIDHLFLVGGMVRMPLVQQKVEEFFGKKPKKVLDPDEVVAMGAAIAGSVIKDGTLQVRGVKTEVQFNDVTSKDLGVQIYDKNQDNDRVMSVLIPRGSSLPVDARQIYSTAADNQSTVSVEVFEGNEAIVDFNSHLGSFELQDIPPMPAKQPQIEVAFDLNADSILNVSAKEISTGKSKNITVALSQERLSAKDISTLRKQLKISA